MSKNEDSSEHGSDTRTGRGEIDRNDCPTVDSFEHYTATGAESFHPGQPRVVTVGSEIINPAFVGAIYESDTGDFRNRDHFSPRLPVLRHDPTEYDDDDFEWSIGDRPAGSSAELSFSTATNEEQPRYDHGRGHATEFVPDEPGRYTLELVAPDRSERPNGSRSSSEARSDGVYEQTVHAFPEPSNENAGQPRVELDATYEDDEFVVEATPELAPSRDGPTLALDVTFLVDDRDSLSEAEMTVDDTTARVPVEALEGDSARIHAVAYDGNLPSVVDTVELSPDGTMELPNRPPAWLDESVVYEIFTRSFHGERGETDFGVLTDRVSYLDDLGVDVVWLTPVVPSVSGSEDLSGGGPHGYDTLDYFDVAPDLAPASETPIEAYETFVEACHDHDIKVLFDLVANHCGRDHDFFQASIDGTTDRDGEWPLIDAWDEDSKYYDWFHRVHQSRYDRTGDQVEPEPRVTGFYDHLHMPNWNYDNLAVREHMLAAADFWSGEIGVDGFRCDIAWGVPHDFWKDVREVVRGNNSEFLMLDETIPHDSEFAENEFDAHFDTASYTETAHAVARGEADAFELLDAVEAREDKGFPDYTRLLNATENHDEKRLLNEALSAGAYDDPEHVQRACWAASVALPGVPFVYYGQERAISRHGEGRHLGAGDPRENDVRAGGKQRAFMNWDEYDEEHLQFYKTVIDRYQDLDALKPAAGLDDVWFRTEDHVLVFGRDASDMEEVSGPERAVVVVNFEDGDPATVELPPAVETTDELTGRDVAVECGDTTTVDIETIAVLETPTFDALGEPIATWRNDSQLRRRNAYDYPTHETFADGSFDLQRFEVREFDDSYQFVFEFDTIENVWNRERGFSVQLPQVYIRDPSAGYGSLHAHPGVAATLESVYQHRIIARPEGHVSIETGNGSILGTGGAETLTDRDAVLVWIQKSDLPDLSEVELVPLVTGYDASNKYDIRQTAEEATDWTFGTGPVEGTAPNVTDLITPAGVDRDDALAPFVDGIARIPYLSID